MQRGEKPNSARTNYKLHNIPLFDKMPMTEFNFQSKLAKKNCIIDLY